MGLAGKTQRNGNSRMGRIVFVTALIATLIHGYNLPLFAQSQVGTERVLKTGENISLDLKGVDILDVLKLLSQQSRLNFVAGRNVTGKVTIFVKDVGVWEAFERILEANDLAYERYENIVTVMTARDYELLYGSKFQERKENLVLPLRYAKAAQVATVLTQIKSTVGRVVADEVSNTLYVTDVPSHLDEVQQVLQELDRPTATHVYELNYAEAEQISSKIQELLSPLGTMSVDARTNKVIISDLESVLEPIDRMMQAFDAPEGQVLIEAKILKVELSDQMDLGIDWQQLLGGDVAARSNFRLLSDIVGNVSSGSFSGTATGGALKLFTGTDDTTQIVIEALQKIGRTETLSNPRIMVSNNQEAKILVGSKEAFVTVTTTVPESGSVVTAPQIEFVDVGTKLFVTPKIKRDGNVQMKIRPEVSTAKIETFQQNRIPILTTTEAETNVLVESGKTLMIGGLIDRKTEETKSRVPLLGNIPIVGMAFRNKSDSERKSEIVVFITPQIVLPDGSPAQIPSRSSGSISQPPLSAPRSLFESGSELQREFPSTWVDTESVLERQFQTRSDTSSPTTPTQTQPKRKSKDSLLKGPLQEPL